MDAWGLFWIFLTVFLFPFGYKPIIILLSIASIFSAGKVFSIGSSDVPIFFFVEIMVILRLILPNKNHKFLTFKDSTSFVYLLFIISLWLYTYLVANLFGDLRVFSSINSMEDSYRTGGVFLNWSSANINQLMLLTAHLLLALICYKRKDVISKIFYFKTIVLTSLIFMSISFIWKFQPDLYSIIGFYIFNNLGYAINALHEARLSGTFLEPSAAGLYISTLCIPFLVHENKNIKLLGLVFIYLSFLNLSSTLFFSLIVSFLIIWFSTKLKLDYKVLWVMLLIILISLLFFLFGDEFFSYIDSKSLSQSGEVRAEVNANSIVNIYKSYFFGIGLGSERTSSMFLTLFNNLGFLFGPLLIYIVYRLLSPIQNDKVGYTLRMMLLISFFGSFVSMPELTNPIMWNLIFANIFYRSSAIADESKKGAN